MKLSKKVWLLWGWRILMVNTLLYPVADYFKNTFNVAFLLLFCTDAALITILVIKFTSTRVAHKEGCLTILQGFLLRRTVCVRLKYICATRKISTPLCLKLRLCYLIIYCEGARFILPPLKNNVATYIEKECRKR